MTTTRRSLLALAGAALVAGGLTGLPAQPLRAETVFKPIPVQFIAALGEPTANSGTGADAWGLWRLDPGPRGVRLDSYDTLKQAGGVAPAGWTFNTSDWWLEEHGLIMEQPPVPLPPGKYLVTGDRRVQTVLTIHAKTDGAQRWELADGATLYDVTHLRCRSARYRPAAGNSSCTPDKAQQSSFPVAPGGVMPAIDGCLKQDYAVLFIVAEVIEN
jgi:hypothetical protein